MLTEAVDTYLAVRRAVGFELRRVERLLRSFAEFASQRADSYVRAQTAVEWAALARSPAERARRLQTVIRFARHARAETAEHEVPADGVFGQHRRRPIPFIFAPIDIGRLVYAASQLGPAGSFRAQTYSTLFALLAVTGLRISEALALRFDDVTPDGLVIRATKFRKSRLVPLHETSIAALDGYLRQRRQLGSDDTHLFLSTHQRPLYYSIVNRTFHQLVRGIGLEPPRGSVRPRLHSFRHTFAVRTLERCPEGRDRVSKHMLALSTYLGHVGIANTYWYLQATPELTADIAEACRSLVYGGAP